MAFGFLKGTRRVHSISSFFGKNLNINDTHHAQRICGFTFRKDRPPLPTLFIKKLEILIRGFLPEGIGGASNQGAPT